MKYRTDVGSIPVLKIIFLLGLAFILFTLFQNHKAERNSETNSETITISELVSTLSATDPRLLEYVRKHHITPPSSEPYNLSNPNAIFSDWSTPVLKRLLKNMTGGFFVEAGSNDGETYDGTLGFEHDDGWTGLLVEPSPIEQANLRFKHRKAWIADVCLSVVPTPHSMSYLHRVGYSIASKFGTKDELEVHMDKQGNTINSGSWKHYIVSCFPLITLLKALDITTIDYFNLDVEGVELEVLKTLPFKEVFIKTISIEMHTGGELEKKSLKGFMALQGYKLEMDRHPDYIFAHPSLYA